MRTAIVAAYNIGPVPVEVLPGVTLCCPEEVEISPAPTLWDMFKRVARQLTGMENPSLRGADNEGNNVHLHYSR